MTVRDSGEPLEAAAPEKEGEPLHLPAQNDFSHPGTFKPFPSYHCRSVELACPTDDFVPVERVNALRVQVAGKDLRQSSVHRIVGCARRDAERRSA